jgi:hypothetical protein
MGFTIVSRVSANPASAPYASPAQSHGAGNSLVAMAIHGDVSTVLNSVSNTAGDVWHKSASSPFFDSVGHYHEAYYVPSTKGNASDVVTFNFSNSDTTNDFSVVVYEISAGGFMLNYTGIDGTGANGADPNNFMFTPTLSVSLPSIIMASLRNSNDNTPINYSLTSLSNTGGELTKYDGYQLANSSQAVTAHISGNPFAQWSIQALVFATGSLTPVGGGCFEDLPATAGGGQACSGDVSNV